MASLRIGSAEKAVFLFHLVIALIQEKFAVTRRGHFNEFKKELGGWNRSGLQHLILAL